jgi:hypothetical protein
LTASPNPSRRPPGQALVDFWRADHGLSIFLATLVGLIFVLPPLLGDLDGRWLPGDVASAVLLVSGVLAMTDGGPLRTVLLSLALLSVAVDLASWLVPVPQPLVSGTSLLSLLLLLVVVLFQTLRDGPVTRHRIQGAIAAYLLLGIAWAHAYALVALLHPGAFSGAVSVGDGPRVFVYFSFVTLTTVGYGDILPVHPTARSLAILEAVTGPLYLAILVARLVSLGVSPGSERPRS